jgi:signal transduction histidine kinase
MLHLHELLAKCQGQVVDGWFRSIEPATVASGPPDQKARDRALTFLNGLIAALQCAAGRMPRSPGACGEVDTDPADGDFDPVAAVRGYGSLHSLILQIAADHKVEPSLAEQMTLAACLNDAVAASVTAHLKKRDRDIHRVAHELRNPLGSAMMALTLLRARADLGDHARFAETMDRNLRRLQALIDEWVARGGSGVDAQRGASHQHTSNGAS